MPHSIHFKHMLDISDMHKYYRTETDSGTTNAKTLSKLSYSYSSTSLLTLLAAIPLQSTKGNRCIGPGFPAFNSQLSQRVGAGEHDPVQRRPDKGGRRRDHDDRKVPLGIIHEAVSLLIEAVLVPPELGEARNANKSINGEDEKEQPSFIQETRIGSNGAIDAQQTEKEIKAMKKYRAKLVDSFKGISRWSRLHGSRPIWSKIEHENIRTDPDAKKLLTESMVLTQGGKEEESEQICFVIISIFIIFCAFC